MWWGVRIKYYQSDEYRQYEDGWNVLKISTKEKCEPLSKRDWFYLDWKKQSIMVGLVTDNVLCSINHSR